MSTVAYSDRSRVLEFRKCPRRRWLAYELPQGPGQLPGMQPIGGNLDLAIGSGFHAGVNRLLSGWEGVAGDQTRWQQLLDLAGVEAAQAFEASRPSENGLLLQDENYQFLLSEARAQVAGLVLAYALVCLPKLVAQYEIVEAELDESCRFESADGEFALQWGFRTDALLMERGTKDLYILSLKTAKEIWPGQNERNQWDMQGKTELAGVEQRLQRWQQTLDAAEPADAIPVWFQARWSEGHLPVILGVKMEFALKGRKSNSPKGSSRYISASPLTRFWKNDQGLGLPMYAPAYEWQDPDGSGHRLGKGWVQTHPWLEYDLGGVEGWVTKLATEEFLGRPPGWFLEQQFVLPEIYFRNPLEIDRELQQILFQERRIAEGRQQAAELIPQIGAANPDASLALESTLAEYFPTYPDYPNDCVKCPFRRVCPATDGITQYAIDPMSSGWFEIRERGNHEAEEIRRTATKEGE